MARAAMGGDRSASRRGQPAYRGTLANSCRCLLHIFLCPGGESVQIDLHLRSSAANSLPRVDASVADQSGSINAQA